MRNIIGSPAEGDDFFDRPKILKRLLRELNDLANILSDSARKGATLSVRWYPPERLRREPFGHGLSGPVRD